jgi:O-antigen/teichoic acid export membrane protein
LSRAAESEGALSNAFKDGTSLAVWISAPVFLGLFFVSEEVVIVFFGREWTQARAALEVVTAFSLFNFFRLLAQPTIKAAGCPGALVLQQLAGLCFVATASLFTSNEAFEHQILVWALFGPVYFVLSFISLKSATSISWQVQVVPIIKPALACILMSLTLTLVDSNSAITHEGKLLAIKVTVGIASYLVAAFALNFKRTLRLLRSNVFD